MMLKYKKMYYKSINYVPIPITPTPLTVVKPFNLSVNKSSKYCKNKLSSSNYETEKLQNKIRDKLKDKLKTYSQESSKISLLETLNNKTNSQINNTNNMLLNINKIISNSSNQTENSQLDINKQEENSPTFKKEAINSYCTFIEENKENSTLFSNVLNNKVKDSNNLTLNTINEKAELLSFGLESQQKQKRIEEKSEKKEVDIFLGSNKDQTSKNKGKNERNSSKIKGKYYQTPLKSENLYSKMAKELGSMSKLPLYNKIQKYNEICKEVLKKQGDLSASAH